MAVVLNIISKFDDRGVQSAQRSLAKFGSGARGFAGSTGADLVRTGRALDDVGNKAINTGRAMTAASLPLIAGFALSARAAMGEAKEVALLEKAMRNATGATAGQVAAMEAWITKTQNATGVADGELRPAMAHLLRATGDATRSQDLMNQALDISAATGKPIEQVALAMAKAHNGNVGALGRLGIATKSADGATMTFEQTLAKAAETMGGSAAAAADTAAGRTAIMQAKLADASETLGTALLPMIERGTAAIAGLADRFNDLSPSTQGWIVKAGLAAIATGPLLMGVGGVTKGLGALSRVSGNVAIAFGKNAKSAPLYARAIAGATKGVGSFARSVATGVAALGRQAAAATVAAARTVAHTAATIAARSAQLAVAAASKAWAAAQWLLNAAMSANPIGLVVVAVAGLVAAFVIAWKKSETFRRIVTGAWEGIKRSAFTVFNGLAGFFRSWGPRIVTILTGPIGALVLTIARNWDRIRSSAAAAFGAVVSFARGFPGRIRSAVGNLGRLLYSAGRDVVYGLRDGISAAWSAVTERIRSLISSLSGVAKKALGISSPSKVFAEIGRQSGAGLVLGLEGSRGMVAAAGARLAGAAAGLGGGPSYSPVFAGSSSRGSRSVVVAPGAVRVEVNVGSGEPSAVEGAVRAGIEPALVQLVREIGRL